MDLNEVQLKWRDYAANIVVDHATIEDAKLKVLEDYVFPGLLVQLKTAVLAEEIAAWHTDYYVPKSWWQHFKQDVILRLLNRWGLWSLADRIDVERRGLRANVEIGYKFPESRLRRVPDLGAPVKYAYVDWEEDGLDYQ